MTTDQIILFSLFGGVFVFLLWGKFRYDLVAFTALLLGVVAGVIPTKHAFDGFGHPATLVVALVLVVSAGLVRSGAVFLITRTLINASRSLGGHIALMGAIGGVLSGFMNNVAALALLMPVDIQTGAQGQAGTGAFADAAFVCHHSGRDDHAHWHAAKHYYCCDSRGQPW